MAIKYHIDGTEEFGYITINRFLYSFYMYMNTVKRLTNLYNNASVQFLKGYVAHFCYLRLKSFDTFIKVVWEHKDYVSANCLLRMLGDSVAVFRLIYMEADKDLLILRHSLYVIDGCERNLKVLPEENVYEDCLSAEELAESNKVTQRNRAHRQRLMREAQEMLESSQLKQKDKAAFDRIVEDRNWKFKEFKDYKNKRSNQYQWRELYELIGCCKGFDLLSYISQYAHGLSMSNLVIELDEQNINGVVGEALGLIKRLHKYTMAFYPEEQRYILEELLEPDMRDKILACYDEAHRPDVATWNNGVMNKMQQLSYTGSYEIIF
jgi:hypothetical protein